jgi:hypothetical protein
VPRDREKSLQLTCDGAKQRVTPEVARDGITLERCTGAPASRREVPGMGRWASQPR